MARGILVLGASYGSLLATKLLMAGHHKRNGGLCPVNPGKLVTCNRPTFRKPNAIS
jgi:hypothetical protein